MNGKPRIRVVRVVTAAEIVVWHLGASLHELAAQFELHVVGQNVSVHAAAYPGVHWTDIDIPRKTHIVRDLAALWRLYCFFRTVRPDIVHSIMPKAGLLSALAAFLAGVPVRMHTFTGQVWDLHSGLRRWFFIQLDRLIVSLNTGCLTDSPSQSKHLFDEGIRERGRMLPVLGRGSLIGVDLVKFDPKRIRKSASVSRESLGLTAAEFVVAYVARKSADKGAFDMLRGFSGARRDYPQMRLLFVGPDESRGVLAKLRGHEPELFEGVLERGAVQNHEEYLNLSDLLCLPSHREGFGSIIIDAAALGVPAVGSRIKGLVDSIEDGVTGCLVTRGDTTELATTLAGLARDRVRLRKLGENARLRVEQYFSTEALTRALIEQYEEQLRRWRPLV